MDALEKEYFDEMKENQEEIKEMLFRISEKLGVKLEDEEFNPESETSVEEQDFPDDL